MKNKIETTTFGAGCFWHVEEEFRKLDGVSKTEVGFMGGKTKNPTYKEVCTGKTGHVEVVQVEFDPSVISYEDLLNVFWKIHNPTSLNRQGADIGSQYKSIIFYYTKEQKEKSIKSKKQLESLKAYKKPIVTEIVKASEFWMAEEYHQKYLMKHGLMGCPV